MTSGHRIGLAVSMLIFLLASPSPGDDWPAYRGDNQRSGFSSGTVAFPLQPQWTFTAAWPPMPAWGDPKGVPIERILELPRMRFDDAFQVVAAGDSVYFGSSADTKVYALDARTGRVRWEFCTEGPVRLAPAVAEGRVYVGSDDGRAYCLDGGTGKLLWKFSAAPTGEMVLGNGRMASNWPIRTGVLVDGGAAYFAAGVLPGEGVYLYAVDARDGRLLWKNDTYGLGGRGNIAPQGYLLASGDKLFVPSSRMMPAAFDRKTGRLLFHRNYWRVSGLMGGTYNVLAGGLLLNATEQIAAISTDNGNVLFNEGLSPHVPSEGTRRLAVGEGKLCMVNGREAIAVDLKGWVDLRGQIGQPATQPQQGPDKKPVPAVKWRVPCRHVDSLIMTKSTVFIGGRDVVVGLDSATGRTTWEARVSGRARGLAIAGGRLLVSTDRGRIHCFAAGAGADRQVAQPQPAQQAAGQMPASDAARVASAIVADSGATRGYALVLGGGGELAMELARRTELMIYVIEPRRDAVAAARKMLTDAGYYGGRVVVMQAPLETPPCGDYFANLIICQDSFSSAAPATPVSEVLRMLKPCGGAAYVGSSPLDARQSASAEFNAWMENLRKELGDLSETGTKIETGGARAKIVRGPLAGAGAWTHQYANAANTACSDDRLVRGPIGVLWYGLPGPGDVPNRHVAAAGPLAAEGRLFVQGDDGVMAYDAYNGLKLWERNIPDILRRGLREGACSNMATDGKSLFVAVKDQCLRLDAATGRTLRTYQAPPGKDGRARDWGYVACAGGLLYGGRGNSRAADLLLAFDVQTGRLRWSREVGVVAANAICIDGARLFYIDKKTTPEQVAQALKGIEHQGHVDARGKSAPPDVRLVVALDAGTGRVIWQQPQYVSQTVEAATVGPAKRPVGVFGTMVGGDLTVMAAGDVLLLCGQPWNGHFWQQFFAGEFSRRSLIALSAADGRFLWSGKKGYRSRPLIVGDSIIAEPWSYELKTGRPTDRVSPVTGQPNPWQFVRPGHHCGNVTAAPNALFFRSGVMGYYDLQGDYGTAHFGAIRPGCWGNCIAADGLVLMPESGSGCICPFSVQCTVVFRPRRTNRMWGFYSATGRMTPVKRLAVNFGAPGDRNDSRGNLWLACPRPTLDVTPSLPGSNRLILQFDLPTRFEQGGGYYSLGTDPSDVTGTPQAMIYASGCRGLAWCRIPLTRDLKAMGTYTVRLHFAEPDPAAGPGRRIFDVLLQDKIVLKDFDIAAQAGPLRAVVKEFKGVPAADSLTVTMKASRGDSLLSGLEVLLEKYERPPDEKDPVAAARQLCARFRISASHNPDQAGLAADGIDRTRWTAAAPMAGGEWLTIEAIEKTAVSEIILDAGLSPDDYPRQYEVYASDDGKSWGSAILKGAGAAITRIKFERPVTRRFIRIVQTGKVANRFWSIQELDIMHER